MSINSVCPECSRRLPVDLNTCTGCCCRLPQKYLRRFKVKWKTPSGKWLTKTVTGLSTARMVEMEFRFNRPAQDVVVQCPTLQTVWDSYHKIIDKKSISDDAQRFRDYLASLAALPLDKITPNLIEDIMAGMKKSKKSPATCRLVFALLRSLLNWAIRRQLFKGPNPCSMVQAPKVNNARTRVLTKEEADRLLQALQEHPNRHLSNIIRFLLLTGKRRGEVRSLEWSDVDEKNRTVTFRGTTTKNGKTTVLPMSEAAMDVLKEARMLRNSSSFVFPSSTGGYYHDLNATWSRFRVKMGLMDVRIHDLRRSFGSFAVSNGVDLYVVSRLLGHSSTTVTQRVYAHLNLDALRHGAEAVGKVLEMDTSFQTT